jgi:dephospho-CoA kinase
MSDGKSLVITGGIGTGKSAVSGFLGSLGWSIIDADQVGHSVLGISEVVILIEQEWPEVVVGGVVTRKRLGDLVFADPGKLAKLEAITHPFIRSQIDSWLTATIGPRAVEVSAPKAIKAAWGPVVVIDAPEPVRIERAMARGLDRSAVMARLASQPQRQQWLQLADFIVSNSGSVADLEEAVARLSKHIHSL